MEKKMISRRQFLKYGGTAAAGIGLSTFNLPFLRLGKASAALSDSAWCFGVMADTQWKTTSQYADGKMSVATGIIDKLNNQFIEHGCKFVIQVGDLVNNESVDGERAMPTRAAWAQDLYDAGIGFFPVRGNHESSSIAANEVQQLFPQTQAQGDNVNDVQNIQSPDIIGLQGLSYSMDYENARCILIDQFVRSDATNYNGASDYADNILDQLDWIEDRVSSRDSGTHAFLFAHKNLIGQSHKDNIFGSNLTSNATQRDEFLAMCSTNKVGYYFGGHDHMHHRSLVSTSAGDYDLTQIICSSNSYKFYSPFWGDDGRKPPLPRSFIPLDTILSPWTAPGLLWTFIQAAMARITRISTSPVSRMTWCFIFGNALGTA